ncbi:MAG TPA: hypothetical protein IAA29_05780 [Candidatus Paenibacillus intestinavium]|nr:hypothetical protein [Candidatus Paenibacillus intestinavium]
MNGKSLLGIICIVIGGILALKFFNILLGPIIGFLLPFILIACGFYALKNGKKIIGSLFLIIGFVLLFGNLGSIITLILAIVLIVGGISFIKGKFGSRY